MLMTVETRHHSLVKRVHSSPKNVNSAICLLTLMSTKLPSDDVYSETSQWTMTSGGGRGGGVGGCARSMNPFSERHGKHITIANGCLLHYSP